jgi:hypothetical protein
MLSTVAAHFDSCLSRPPKANRCGGLKAGICLHGD